ncbi:Protein of unknown function [Polaromonas sp. YR568]|uniref:DUF1579 domain-containing protein n=1 Tax=Polaromonas sp. YR568 TaxID=1855301 RepID=UPI0008F13D2E|nr:DUF1579 domain-containing protein [Polaromonas sp. YR568]SFU70687.1 Protein of unknown function [Polaromonas sp. YR568]
MDNEMKIEAPQKEHLWLQQLLGDWTFTSEMEMAPGQPAMKGGGSESVRAIGGFWVLSEGSCQMPGSDGGDKGIMLTTLGYDPKQNAFVGTWVGSMMTNMWVYKGKLDASQKVLTLDTEGPSFSGDGKLARYQDVLTIKNKDERTLHSQVRQDDGSWKRFMIATYRRVK